MWLTEGHGVALGTVIQTWGSAPRPAGSQIAVRDDGAFLWLGFRRLCRRRGDRSGTRRHRRRQKPGVWNSALRDAEAWEVGLACGGRIRIFVEPVEA